LNSKKEVNITQQEEKRKKRSGFVVCYLQMHAHMQAGLELLFEKYSIFFENYSK